MTQRPEPATLSGSRRLRLAYFFLFYAAQGMAIGLFNFAVPAWLAANGASMAEVGAVVGAAMFPWGVKFLNGFIVDRFTWLPMGRRRAWIVGSQLGLLAGFGVLALVDPSVDDVATLSALGFALNLVVNFQDVSVDGLAADLVPEVERGRTAGVMFGGQSLGIAATSTVAGGLLASHGMRGAALACTVYVAAVLALAATFRERPGERLLPWMRGAPSHGTAALHVDAWRPLLAQAWRAMARRECLLLWFAALSIGAAWGMSLSVLPAMATRLAGYGAAEYSALTGGINLAAGVAAFLLLGPAADRLGPLRMYRMAVLACLLACAAMLAAQPWWSSVLPITLLTMAFLTLRLVINVPYSAMALGLSTPAVAATQMTLFNSPGNLGASLCGFLLPSLERSGGPVAILAAMAAFAAVALGLALAIPGGRRILAPRLQPAAPLP
ncbi:MAG: MFS transporter [Steroidobacteraceae bacterium]|jgi:PAT family beta-lactamase induction signal transducer AmpG|nr:MFS transporter [Steroidobacteraceae bacterium]